MVFSPLTKEFLAPEPITPSYEEVITQIVGEQIAINWDWVANPQGEGDRVSEKVHQFVDERLIVLPADQNHLTIRPRPQPSFLTRHFIWGRTKEEFDEERNDLFWKLISHDPTCNSVDYDPKIIVLNSLGNDEHEIFAKHFHCPDLTADPETNENNFFFFARFPVWKYPKQLVVGSIPVGSDFIFPHTFDTFLKKGGPQLRSDAF
ncbi:hypothetical protein C8R43DRAFT_951560 [Mycena crocata]|nr:hypothetical protein C8R43DRAFT_951560 [Mycena crocata]